MRRDGRGLRATALAALVLAGLSGCVHKKSQPAIEYMPNMAYGPRVPAQHEDPTNAGVTAMLLPVPGTVPRDYTPYRFAQADTTEAMRELTNPLPRTAEVLGRGQRVFMTYCVVCHGPKGDGQGYIVPKFPMPPVLFSDKVVNWPDGRIFHVISRGQNLMPSYASQILPEDRWAVIYYVRALQRAARPTAEDLASSGQNPPAGAAPAAASASAPATTPAPATGGGGK